MNALKTPQGWSLEKLGEYALRPSHAAIMVLNKAHRLLSDALSSGANGKARFFISHAKLDGLPLGVQVIAASGRDDLALAAAQLIEKTYGQASLL